MKNIGHPFVVTFIVVSKTSLPNLSISFWFYKYMILAFMYSLVHTSA